MAPRRRDEDSGQYTEIYAKSDIIDALAGTRLSTTEVAEALDCHRTTAHDRLRDLETEGILTSKGVGNTLLWELDENDDP